MITSEKTDLIFPAIAASMAKFPVITKGRWNSHFESHYADLADIREAIRPILEVNDLAIMQPWDAKGAVVVISTRIQHKSGQYIELLSSAEAKNPSAQAVGAAVTFISRYALIAALSLSVANSDDDGNSTRRDDDGQEPGQQGSTPPSDIFDMKTGEHELAAELKSRNVPEAKWEAIGRWLHGKNRNQLSKAIVSV